MKYIVDHDRLWTSVKGKIALMERGKVLVLNNKQAKKLGSRVKRVDDSVTDLSGEQDLSAAKATAEAAIQGAEAAKIAFANAPKGKAKADAESIALAASEAADQAIAAVKALES